MDLVHQQVFRAPRWCSCNRLKKNYGAHVHETIQVNGIKSLLIFIWDLLTKKGLPFIVCFELCTI